MNKETKDFIKLSFKTHWVSYTCGYLVYSFIIWEFKNPFEWVLNLNNYDASDRILLLFAISVYVIIIEFIAFNIKLHKDGK